MRRLVALAASLLGAACGGLASPDQADPSQTQGIHSAASPQGVVDRYRNYRYRTTIFNDYALPGDVTLFTAVSTDPAFFEDRCAGGLPPPTGDDWAYFTIQDVFPAAGKENLRISGKLFTRVYRATYPDPWDGFGCALVTGRAGTLLAEGVTRFDEFIQNSCTPSEHSGLVGAGHLETLPAFPCESGTARLTYAYRYTLSKDAVLGADCSLTAGEDIYKQIEGPTLTCIGK